MAQVVEVDVLVVGGGGAALRAAIEAHRAGARVALAVKGQLGAVGLRGAGATASGTATDRRSFWPVDESGGVVASALEDILQLGLGMADPRLARIVVEEAPSSRRVLEQLGVRLQLLPGRAHAGASSTPPRGFPATHTFGLVPSLSAMIRRIDCRLLEHTMVVGLLTADGVCGGAVAIDEETGETVVIRAGAVLLGTGGAAQLFKHHIHPSCVTGDGYAIGYRAGAELMNLEFMQIFLGTVFPTVNNLTNWVWREDLRARNARGDEFLELYMPPGANLDEAKAQAAQHSPFSTRDTLSRYLSVAMMKEAMAGRATVRDGIYMDLTSPRVRVPEERDAWLRYRGIECDQAPLEVVVFAMCSHGGLRIDANAQTTVPGLYAVGECSAGAYGADRHGGNMMSSSQVFGARAGRHAARSATGSRRPPLPHDALAEEERQIDALRDAQGRLKPKEVRRELQQAAWNHLLAVRTEAGLTHFLDTLEGLGREQVPDLAIEGPRELVQALELRNLLTTGEMLGRAALMRAESRGGHYREDHPSQDDVGWLKSIVVTQVDGGMDLRTLALHPEWKSRPGDMFGERWG